MNLCRAKTLQWNISNASPPLKKIKIKIKKSDPSSSSTYLWTLKIQIPQSKPWKPRSAISGNLRRKFHVTIRNKHHPHTHTHKNEELKQGKRKQSMNACAGGVLGSSLCQLVWYAYWEHLHVPSDSLKENMTRSISIFRCGFGYLTW